MVGVPCDVAFPIVGERGVRGDGKRLPSPPSVAFGSVSQAFAEREGR